MPQTKTRIVCTQLQISSWFFRNRNLRTLSKNGFCPQTRPDAQFEQMIHGTAFEKTGFHVSKLKKCRTKPVANRPHCRQPLLERNVTFFQSPVLFIQHLHDFFQISTIVLTRRRFLTVAAKSCARSGQKSRNATE